MKLIQLTDLHLFAKPDGGLMGVNTFAALQAVLAVVRQQAADAILLTGDISQDASEASYRRRAEALADLGLPVHWIAGNHDDAEAAARVFAQYACMRRLDTLQCGDWTLLGVDGCVAGQDGGRIDESGLAALQSRLAQVGHGLAAVVLHHHPLKVGTPLLDGCMLETGEALWQALVRVPRARLAICGHVHGDHSMLRDGVALEVCPAVCFQWRKGASEAVIDPRHGFRLFDFQVDGYAVETLFL